MKLFLLFTIFCAIVLLTTYISRIIIASRSRRNRKQDEYIKQPIRKIEVLRQQRRATPIFLLVTLLAVSVHAGCGGDDDIMKAKVASAPSLSVSPSSGSEIYPDTVITLTSDNQLTDVTVSLTDASTTRVLDTAPVDFVVSPDTAADIINRINVTDTALVSLRGKMVIVTGPFRSGPISLTISWADGSTILLYTVKDYCAPCPPSSFNVPLQ